MLLVRQVQGPATARVGEQATYRVTELSEPSPSAKATAGIHWLAKTADGAAVLSERNVGPVLTLTVPPTWSGASVSVMPYLRSPSASIAAVTTVASESASPPPSGTMNVPPSGTMNVRCEREKSRWYASIDGQPRFYVGTDVAYGTRRGLMNTANPPGPRYGAEDYEQTHGDWAWYLLPTITAESNRFFTCLNTYDRARFTFGHIQLAAHTPNDNFVLLLREMLALPLAPTYFPELAMKAGRVHRRVDGGTVPLESGDSTADLMAYFNPTAAKVDDSEVERAARIVDWCVRDAAFRDLQVDFAIRQQQRKLKGYAAKVPLHGTVDKLCLVVLDILHQGRGTFAQIKNALAADDPFDNLLAIGAKDYAERIATVRGGIRGLEERGKVGHKVYDRTRGDFVVPDGA